MTTHGGSGISSTYRLTTSDTSIFVKTASGPDAGIMFEGEHASLNAIHAAVPSLCPKSFAWGAMDDGGGYFLATEFLDMGRGFGRTRWSGKGKGSGMTLAEKLALLHTTPAPVPDGYDRAQFGFSVTTCCGETPQPNPYMSSWADFFAQNRLKAIIDQGERRNGKDPELRKLVMRTIDEVVPRLLKDGHLGGSNGIQPVVVHGDLWSGNKGRASFVGRGGRALDETGQTEDVIFDPSACYAHSEYDHGIMMMFGGFGSSFWTEYHGKCPKTDPTEEYEDRVSLYESYHHLNHWAIFGGSYRSGATNLLKGLLKKYGSRN